MAECLGEAVVARWPARCRKAVGTLSLTATRLIHMAKSDGSDQDGSTVIELDGVKFELSKKRPNFDQALVRLSNLPASCQHLGSRLVIEFIDQNASEQKWSNLREFSELMRGRTQEVKDREAEQESVLASKVQAVMSSELSKQYMYLVKQTAVMTPEKFVEIHSREIAQNSPLPEAPSLDLAPLRVVAAAQRNQHVGGRVSLVSEADKAAIFKELPALNQLFNAAVPSMMTETQFWERCLKSRYFLSAAGNPVSHAHPEDRLFDSLEAPVKSDLSDLKIDVGSDPEADLTGEFQRDRLDRANRSGSATLISRLNERSAGILSQAPKAQESLTSHVEKRREKLRTAVQTFQEDLTLEQSTAKAQRLQLQPEAGSLLPQKRKTESTNLSAKQLNFKRPSPGGSISESGTRWVLKSSLDELLKAERLREESHLAAESSQMAGATALLQHIWSSRCTESDLRARLCQEAKKILSDATVQVTSPAARSLIPSLQRAVALIET